MPKFSKPASRKLLQFLTVMAIAAVGTLALERAGWLEPLENVYYDTWHQFAGKRREPSHAAIIAVDDVTLLQFKDEPLAFWAPHFARAMDTLTRAGAKA